MTAAVYARGLGKRYRLYRRPADRAAEWLAFGLAKRHTEHWALRDLDLEVEPGRCLGLVGANGSGKSTVLKILTGTTPPTEGTFEVAGRLAAVLELGLGFHPDFTGRQNASVALALQGHSPARVETLLPAVEAFAEVGSFFDQPLRTYSSGMHVRLAFSAATAERPDVLAVDEALAVGDAYFQHKCYARLREFLGAGTALLFVSHDPGAVKSLCDRAVLLERGRPLFAGDPSEVLDHYNALVARQEADASIRRAETERGVATVRSGNGQIVLEKVELLDARGASARAFLQGERALLRVVFRARQRRPFPTVGLLLRDPKGNDVFGTNTFHLGLEGPELAEGEAGCCEFAFPVDLGPGAYTLTAALHTGGEHVECNYDWWDKVLALEVVAGRRPRSVGVAAMDVTAAFSRL